MAYDDPPIVQQLQDTLASMQRDLQVEQYDVARLTDLLADAYEDADAERQHRLREFNELQRQITVIRNERDAALRQLEENGDTLYNDERQGQR